MTTITVVEIKEQWDKPDFTLFIDDKQSDFTHRGSRSLTSTDDELGDGIFNKELSVVKFKRKSTWVTVNFETIWEVDSFVDPAQEIKRRILLVKEAFEAVSEGYEKVWTVNLNDDNEYIEYIEKRKAEAVEATHYFGGQSLCKVDENFEWDEDADGNECFRVSDKDGDYLIAFCEIPEEAYFLKLTRID